MPRPYFKIAKVIFLINGKILNQPMKFLHLCQFLIQRELPNLFLNCLVTCTSCSPFSAVFLSWVLHSKAVFQLFSIQNKFLPTWYVGHLMNCFPCPRVFSVPVPLLKLWCSLHILFSSEVALGVLLTSYCQDQSWILEKGAHCFDFPRACYSCDVQNGSAGRRHLCLHINSWQQINCFSIVFSLNFMLDQFLTWRPFSFE